MSTTSQQLWLNTFVSLLHSTLISILVVHLYASKSIREILEQDMIFAAEYFDYVVLSISTGYFAYGKR